MHIDLIVGDSTKTNYLIPNSVLLYDNLDARTALTFQMRMPTSDTRPIVGQPIYLATGTTYVYPAGFIFGGSLDNYTETVLNPLTGASSNIYLSLNCNAVDFTQMLNKRLVYKSYPSSGIGDYDSVAATSSFVTDGLSRAWRMDYPMTIKPVLRADGLAVDPLAISTYMTPSTRVWFYEPSSYMLLATTTAAAPAAGTTMDVVYTAMVGLPAYDSDIINDINTNFFNGEGIDTTTFVTKGTRVKEINFNYLPGNEAMNQICEITGRAWDIDPGKRMRYFARTENPAPFDINSTSDNWRSLTVTRSRDKYRNKEYVLGSYGVAPAEESFYGDGLTRTFSLASPVYDEPVIMIDGIYTASVGLFGAAASTFGWYWSRESNLIAQNSTNTVLASTDWLTVKYMGLSPAVAVAVDGEEILERAAIEGNSGLYESETISNKSYTGDASLYYGNSILSKYGKPLNKVQFETDEDGLASGQLIHITLPQNDLDDFYYITSITARDVDMATMRYKVTAVSGVDRGGWVSFFRGLAGYNDFFSEPYVNLAQIYLIKGLGNVVFADSGITVTSTESGFSFTVGTAELGEHADAANTARVLW